MGGAAASIMEHNARSAIRADAVDLGSICTVSNWNVGAVLARLRANDYRMYSKLDDHEHTHTHAHTYMHTYIHIHTTHVHTHVHLCTHHTCTHTTHTHTHAHAHTHTHTRTYTHLGSIFSGLQLPHWSGFVYGMRRMSQQNMATFVFLSLLKFSGFWKAAQGESRAGKRNEKWQNSALCHIPAGGEITNSTSVKQAYEVQGS